MCLYLTNRQDCLHSVNFDILLVWIAIPSVLKCYSFPEGFTIFTPVFQYGNTAFRQKKKQQKTPCFMT